ncbi:MAG: hypothetical protein ACOC22_01500 [bacterium]
MAEQFIIDKLSEIGRAIKRNVLDHVVLTSYIDSNFGRTYVRWFINVIYKNCDDEIHYYKDYMSYRIEVQYSYKDDEERFYLRSSFKETMNKYYNDISRFVELVSSYYPDVKIINFINNFEMFDGKLHYLDGRDIFYLKKSDLFDDELEYVDGRCSLIKDRFELKTLEYYGDVVKEEDNKDERIKSRIECLEEEFNQLKTIKEYHKKNREPYDKKLRLCSSFI